MRSRALTWLAWVGLHGACGTPRLARAAAGWRARSAAGLGFEERQGHRLQPSGSASRRCEQRPALGVRQRTVDQAVEQRSSRRRVSVAGSVVMIPRPRSRRSRQSRRGAAPSPVATGPRRLSPMPEVVRPGRGSVQSSCTSGADLARRRGSVATPRGPGRAAHRGRASRAGPAEEPSPRRPMRRGRTGRPAGSAAPGPAIQEHPADGEPVEPGPDPGGVGERGTLSDGRERDFLHDLVDRLRSPSRASTAVRSQRSCSVSTPPSRYRRGGPPDPSDVVGGVVSVILIRIVTAAGKSCEDFTVLAGWRARSDGLSQRDKHQRGAPLCHETRSRAARIRRLSTSCTSIGLAHASPSYPAGCCAVPSPATRCGRRWT